MKLNLEALKMYKALDKEKYLNEIAKTENNIGITLMKL